MDSWDKLPLKLMNEFAERESYRRDVYRPIYSAHKWWARRPGSTFRMLSLAAMSGDDITKEDILTENESGSYDGMYLQDNSDNFGDVSVLDPFAGGGTSVVEANRLGADTIGYELNPVAWWTIKKSTDNVDLEDLREAFDSVLEDIQDEVGDFYKTTDLETGRDCEILYSLQTQRIPCLSCDEEVNLLPKYVLAKKKKTSPAVVYCPNDDCDDRIIRLNREIQEQETCPSCSTTFDPKDGNCGYGKYTCSNGHKHDIAETLQRLDEKPTYDYFAYQYVAPNGDKKFKEPDADDKEKIDEIETLYDSRHDDLPIPNQDIPEGDKTQALLNYNYDKFRELFSKRHLITFGLLFERAKEVENQNLSEFIITAISNNLNFSSTLCRWHAGYRYGLDVFERHAYVPKTQPVETNPINSQENMGSLQNAFDKLANAKEYCERPFEKVKNKQKGKVEKHEILGETISEDRVKALNCQTSEHLEEDDGSIDYVITDPPYYDNVQYSELSDYFYVWLSETLGDWYDEFNPSVVPKAREIVANTSSGKGEEFFIDGLTNVFNECHRVLDDEGEMVFTYHHNENEAWSVILNAIIDSGFTINGAYPVQSEFPNNQHINKLDNAEYDIILFCSKESVDEEITLSELRDNLYFEIQDMIEEERERHENLSMADLGVILRGKCLQLYSKHYPRVYSEGEEVSVEQALDTVDTVIEQVVEGSVDLPPSLDQLSRSYASVLEQGETDFDTLNKQLMSKGLNVRDLEDEHLVEGSRNSKRAVKGKDRVEYIEEKLDGHNVDDTGDDLLDIDKVHYLAHLYRTEQNTIEYLKAWKSDDLEELAKYVAESTGDETYEQVMEMNLMQF